MGSVWRAVHEGLGRPFAVKFLKATGPNNRKVQDRFFREARLAAAISHRYVVGVLDSGTTPDGVPYMVMEFLQGESLGKRLRRAPTLTVRQLLGIVGQALAGLEAVHRAGVIHRDLKPENIVLVEEADGVIPKLVDFGISCAGGYASLRAEDGSKLTTPGTTVGTPWYMSPEQALAREIDGRTDIYAMGVVLYEALTGVLPFEGPDLLTLLQAVVAGDTLPVEALRPDLGPAVSDLVARAMSRTREARFASAAAMADAVAALEAEVSEALECASRGEGDVVARPTGPSRGPRSSRPIGPAGGATAAVGAAGLGATAAVGAARWAAEAAAPSEGAVARVSVVETGTPTPRLPRLPRLVATLGRRERRTPLVLAGLGALATAILLSGVVGHRARAARRAVEAAASLRAEGKDEAAAPRLREAGALPAAILGAGWPLADGDDPGAAEGAAEAEAAAAAAEGGAARPASSAVAPRGRRPRATGNGPNAPAGDRRPARPPVTFRDPGF